MRQFLESLLNWWVSRPINIPSPSGSTISMEIYKWMEISWMVVLVYTLIPVLVSIVLCYTATDRIGNSFRNRWWLFNILTALIVGFLIYIYLSSQIIVGSDSVVSFPSSIATNRAFVGVLQSLILYYILSGLLSNLLGRIFNINKFRINLRTPIPNLF